MTYFQAVEPSKVKDYLRQKEDNLKDLTKKFEQLLPQLEFFQKEAGKQHKVTLYQGLKGLITAHEHTYLRLKKGDTYHYLGISAGQPQEQHMYWMRDHVRRAKAGIKCKLLFNRDTERKTLVIRNNYKGCDARFMPTNIKTPAYFLIYKDTVMIGIPGRPPLATEIISQEIADSFKAYFDEFWKKSKKFR